MGGYQPMAHENGGTTYFYTEDKNTAGSSGQQRIAVVRKNRFLLIQCQWKPSMLKSLFDSSARQSNISIPFLWLIKINILLDPTKHQVLPGIIFMWTKNYCDPTPQCCIIPWLSDAKRFTKFQSNDLIAPVTQSFDFLLRFVMVELQYPLFLTIRCKSH